jgi:hypothetical protein
MGRCRYSQVGYGATEHEAYHDALRRDREYHGHQEGYSGGMNSSTHEEDTVKCIEKPKISKRCTVTKETQKGARKWKTFFVIEPYAFRGDNGDWNLREERSDLTQAQAIKRAKELAIKHQREFHVMIEKHVVNGSSEIATVKPKVPKQGKWLFTGIARE